jgi:hypothetical protein
MDRAEQAAPQVPMVVVVRPASWPAGRVSVARPELRGRGSGGAHLVLVAGYGTTDRDVVSRAWPDLTAAERLAVAEAFGLDQPDHGHHVPLLVPLPDGPWF